MINVQTVNTMSHLYGGMLLTWWRVTALFLLPLVVTAVSLTVQAQFSKSQRVIVTGVRGSAFVGFCQTQIYTLLLACASQLISVHQGPESV